MIDHGYDDYITYQSIDKVISYSVEVTEMISEERVFLNAVQWANGEGLDIHIMDKKEEKIIPMTWEVAYGMYRLMQVMLDSSLQRKLFEQKQERFSLYAKPKNESKQNKETFNNN